MTEKKKATPKVMKLVDRHNSILECKVCGGTHQAMTKPGGGFYRGAWQCSHGCRLPEKGNTAATGN